MLILNAQILESQGIPYRAASKLLFQERLFVKRQTFSQRVKQVAINLYEEYVNLGIPCLLIESTEQITFWRELQPEFTRSTATPQSRSAQSASSSSSQVAQRLKQESSQEQPGDAIRIELPDRGSVRSSQRSSQKPTLQKPIHQPSAQKPLTKTQQVRSSRAAVPSPTIAIAPAFIPPAPISPAPISPAPATQTSTLPAHLRRLTYR